MEKRERMKAKLWNRVRKEQLIPGDHIYTYRVAYLFAHHGIYIGEGKVIHFTVGKDKWKGSSAASFHSCTSCPKPDSKKYGSISPVCLDHFVGDGKLFRYQYSVSKAHFLSRLRGGTCTLASSAPPEDVIHRAEYLSENGGAYNLFQNNCEDFAVYCKTGLIDDAPPHTYSLAVLTLSLLTAGAHLLRRRRSQPRRSYGGFCGLQRLCRGI